MFFNKYQTVNFNGNFGQFLRQSTNTAGAIKPHICVASN